MNTVVTARDFPDITPELKARLDAAHAEYTRGEYTRFNTPEEAQAWLDSL